MHTHIVTLLNDKFKDKDIKNTYQTKSIDKINRDIQGRVFDDFDLWSQIEIKKLCDEYNSIYEAIVKEARRNSAFKKIENIDSLDFTSELKNPHFNAWQQWMNQLIDSTEITKKLTDFVTKIVLRGCKELLDGHGQLHKNILHLLNWNIFTNLKHDLKVDAVIFSHYHATIAQVQPTVYKNKNMTTASFHLIYFAVTNWLNNRVDEIMQAVQNDSQNPIYYRQFSTQFVARLTKFNNSLLNYVPFLKKLINDDIKYYESHNTRRKKYEFWINVLFDVGVLNQKNDFFQAIWPTFCKKILTDVDFKPMGTNNLSGLDEVSKEQFAQCEELIKQVMKKPLVQSQVDVKSEVNENYFSEMIKQPLLLRDKNILVDELTVEYLSTIESERVKGEMEIFRELLMTCEGTKNAKKSVKELLDHALSQCNTMALKNGPLAKILKTHREAFSAPQPWHDLKFSKPADLKKEDDFISTLKSVYHRVIG